MHALPAAQIAKRRLTLASRRLGTRNPVEAIGGLIDRTFTLPAGDPRYGDSLLTPAAPLPLEHSYSEVASQSLRLDMDVLDPLTHPHAKQLEAGREMRRLVEENFGQPALRWFDQRSEKWRGSGIHGGARFGAWFGLGVDPWGLQEAKVYYELKPGELDGLPPNLQHAARVAMSMLPGLVPIFTSIACGRKRGAQRVYFFHRGDLRLLDLEPLLNQLGIGQQLPSLLTATGVVLGGRFVLPEGAVILGIRDTQKGFELKLDVLLAGLPDPPRDMYDLINMALAERPQSQAALSRWTAALTPDDAAGPGRISVVSFRVAPELPSRCAIYLRPTGYEQIGRAQPGPGQLRGVPPRDPFRV
jgi:hypothetical protein